jgi:hypothetical protein
VTATLVQPDRKVGLHDIGRRLDNLPLDRPPQVVIAIGLGLFFEVYEIFLSSSIATALKTEYGLGGHRSAGADGFVIPRNVQSAQRHSAGSPIASDAGRHS